MRGRVRDRTGDESGVRRHRAEAEAEAESYGEQHQSSSEQGDHGIVFFA